MMDIMVVGIIPEEELERVKWQSVTAVVVNCFESGEGEEERGLPDSHEGQFLGNESTERIEDKAFYRMVV